MLIIFQSFSDSKEQCMDNYIKLKETELEYILKFIQKPSLKEYKKYFHSIDLEYVNLVEIDRNLIPVENKCGENSFYCAISILLFGDESKFCWLKVGILCNLIKNKKSSSNLYDDNFFYIVAKTVDKQLNIYSLNKNKKVLLKSFNENSDETKQISIIFVVENEKNYFIPLFKKNYEFELKYPLELVLEYSNKIKSKITIYDDDIKSIKEKIQEKDKENNMPVSREILRYRGRLLKAGKNLCDYSFLNGDSITVQYLSNFNIKFLQKKIKIVDVDPNDTIEMLKQNIYKQTNIKSNQQRLVFGDITLNDEMKSICDYYIDNESTIDLYEMTKDECMWLDLIKSYYNDGLKFKLEQIITVLGGKIESVLLDLTVPADSINSDLCFSIELSEEHFRKPAKWNYPYGVHKLTPIFELQPHFTKEAGPTIKEIFISFKGVESEFKNIYLFKQENSEDDKTSNIWSCFPPSKYDENEKTRNFEFKFDRLSFVFLGNLSTVFDVCCKYISNNEFRETFEVHQYIRPGLNYCVICNNRYCSIFNRISILNRDFGSFERDPIKEGFDCTKCQTCESDEIYPRIINLVFFRATFSFDIVLKDGSKQNIKHTVTEGNLRFFGNENQKENYSNLTINVEQLKHNDDKRYFAAVDDSVIFGLNKKIPNIFNDIEMKKFTTQF